MKYTGSEMTHTVTGHDLYNATHKSKTVVKIKHTFHNINNKNDFGQSQNVD